jgi:hypothetical protein
VKQFALARSLLLQAERNVNSDCVLSSSEFESEKLDFWKNAFEFWMGKLLLPLMGFKLFICTRPTNENIGKINSDMILRYAASKVAFMSVTLFCTVIEADLYCQDCEFNIVSSQSFAEAMLNVSKVATVEEKLDKYDFTIRCVYKSNFDSKEYSLVDSECTSFQEIICSLKNLNGFDRLHTLHLCSTVNEDVNIVKDCLSFVDSTQKFSLSIRIVYPLSFETDYSKFSTNSLHNRIVLQYFEECFVEYTSSKFKGII